MFNRIAVLVCIICMCINMVTDDLVGVIVGGFLAVLNMMVVLNKN